MKLRRVTVEEKTFGLRVRIQVGGTERSARAECERFCDVTPSGRLDDTNRWAITHNCYAFIHLSRWPEFHEDGTFGTLVHELVHVVRAFLKDVGTNDGETHSNVTQFLYAQAHKKLDK